MKIMMLIAAVAAAWCPSASGAGRKTFVLWDSGLQLPAVCYRLDGGWQGWG